jgi:hypothetical protein
MKISAYISYFYDFDMLMFCLERIYGLVDEIIIIDGPFKYITGDLDKLNIPYHMTQEQLDSLKTRFSNIRYEADIWNDEFEKRRYSFDLCSHDLVLMIDTDEMIDLKLEDFEDIKSGNFGSASIQFLNLCQFGFCFDKSKKAKKNIIFNKNLVSADDHLDYMWIAGYKKKPTTQKIKRNCNSQVYHYSLYRPMRSLMMKYLFYSTLWYLIKEIPNDSLLKQFKDVGPEIMQNMLNRSGITHLGFPHDQLVFDTWFNNEVLDEQKIQISKKIINLDLQINDNICQGYPMYGVIPDINTKKVKVKLEHKVKRIHSEICKIKLESTDRPTNELVENHNTDTIEINIKNNPDEIINVLRIAFDDQKIHNNKILEINYE